MDFVYVLIGHDTVNHGSIEEHRSEVYGAFSTEELAMEAGDELVESGVIEYYTIEDPQLDEFGYR